MLKRPKITSKTLITSRAIETLKENPNGISYSDLVRKLHGDFMRIPVNTIHGTIWNLDSRRPNEVYKPARGLFRHTAFRQTVDTEEKPEVSVPVAEKIEESAFYAPFADWLTNELEECTKAIALGRNKFKEKWGTPDVIGIREPRKSDIIKPPTDIVAAEVKIDSGNLITAFGQACSYKLFSHKSYIVVPRNSPEEDIARLDALGRIFGIGLILFDVNNPKEPNFEIRVRATKHEPDMFYVNKYMKLIEDELFL
jgi:hypothetical protein